MTEKKRTAVVTGGSRGIGRAIAVQLAREGYDIAFCYRREADAAQEVAREVGDAGVQVFHQPCDVTNRESVKAFLQAVEEKLETPRVLINCAGIVRDSPLVLMEPSAWHEVIDTNLTGAYHFCRTSVFGMMKRKQGVIINVSSVSGVYGNATQSNYSAAKAGMIGFSKALAKELAPYNIRVNVVAPGFITTDMTDALDDQIKERVLKMIPLRRFGEVQEVADLVSFLVSDRARYITAQTIQVDGGIVL